MKLIVKSPKPRNPLVALARVRKAGSHHGGHRAHRREAERALKRELERLAKPSP